MTAVGWLCLIFGWTLAAAGALGAAAALCLDRSHGRRRCPRCWYTLAGIPGLTCPECGHAARADRALFRTRRRWRRALAAALVLLVGVAITRIPALQRAGWYGLIPSSILVIITPADFEPSQRAAIAAAAPMPIAGTLLNPAPTAPAPADLRDELWSRLGSGRLARWQSQLFLGRYLRNDKAVTFELPGRWAAGTKLPILIESPIASGHPFEGAAAAARRAGSGPEVSYLPHRWTKLLVPLGDGAGASLSLEFEVRRTLSSTSKILFSAASTRAIDIRRDAASLLDPYSPFELDGLAAQLAGMASFDERTVILAGDLTGLQKRLRCVLGFTATIELGGEVLAVHDPAAEPHAAWKDWLGFPIAWIPGGFDRARHAPGGVAIRFTPDPAVAARIYMDAWAEELVALPPRYWDRSFTASRAPVWHAWPDPPGNRP